MKTTLALLFAAAALVAAAPVPSAHAAGHGSAVSEYGWQALISTRQAISIALRANPGAEYRDAWLVDGSRPYYVVRLMRDGRRFDVQVDAETGRILR
ncbi:MAG: PepSY domain-containing protein [Oceanicaulis sp.]